MVLLEVEVSVYFRLPTPVVSGTSSTTAVDLVSKMVCRKGEVPTSRTSPVKVSNKSGEPIADGLQGLDAGIVTRTHR